MDGFEHVPVLLEECLENLRIIPDGTYVDGTAGGGGHSGEILKRLGRGGLLVSFDRDGEAVEAAGRHLEEVARKTHSEASYKLIHGNYRDMAPVLEELGIGKVNGILLDLGVSSHQLDSPERGFSYRNDAVLDMRMDRDSDGITAYDVVNSYPEKELEDVIFTYGEERWARRIARFIADARRERPVETTLQLVEVIKKAIPKGAREEGGHPAKRTFQAIRIEVNDELGGLRKVLADGIELLAPGGIFAVITFHSLEEGIVKKAFKKAENPCTCPPGLPVCVCGKKPMGKMITRNAILPAADELAANPRSKSARLRVFRRNG